jgi:SAM-dependent methyltransferase
MDVPLGLEQTTVTDVIAAPDLAAIKQRQQATWASGDYHMIGTQILIVSELLIEALDVHSTERVLDVATGSGNAALAAARRGCSVVGLDYVPALLDRARRRAEAEGLEAEFVEGDAEALPFADGSFDVVSSVFGAMFAPDQEQTRERARARLPARRPDRPGRPYTRGLHRPALQNKREARAAARWASLAGPVGHGGTAAGALRRRHRRDPRREAPVRLPLPFARGLRRLLAALLRSDDEGV